MSAVRARRKTYTGIRPAGAAAVLPLLFTAYTAHTRIRVHVWTHIYTYTSAKNIVHAFLFSITSRRHERARLPWPCRDLSRRFSILRRSELGVSRISGLETSAFASCTLVLDTRATCGSREFLEVGRPFFQSTIGRGSTYAWQSRESVRRSGTVSVHSLHTRLGASDVSSPEMECR